MWMLRQQPLSPQVSLEASQEAVSTKKPLFMLGCGIQRCMQGRVSRQLQRVLGPAGAHHQAKLRQDN